MTETTRIALRGLIASSLLTVTFGAQALAAAPGDPDSYTGDDASFADLPVETFQGYADQAAWWGDYTAEAPLVIGDVAYYGMVWVSTGWSIPGMDGQLPDGSANVFLASAVDLTLEPLVPIDRLGFRYGTQFGPFTVHVSLSDGSERSFDLTDQQGDPGPAGSWAMYGGAYGFFGYATGDPNLTIDRVYMAAGDGGIDDVRIGVADQVVCEDLDGDGFTTCAGDCNDRDPAIHPGAAEVCDAIDNDCDSLIDVDLAGEDLCGAGCDLISLESKILALGLPFGFERSLLAKVDGATVKADKGQYEAAANKLEALVSELSAQRDEHIAAADADVLIECVLAIFDEWQV